MAARSWGVSIATAVGVAAGAGAAQLGLGYGLGIIAWSATAGPNGESVWVAGLAWAAWTAATSVVIGAICADRLAASAGPESTVDGLPRRPSRTATVLWRLSITVAAALGGLLTVALVAVPARDAHRADSFAPETIAAGYAMIGVLAGLVAAAGALGSRAVAANVLATVAWLWALAVTAVIHGVAIGRGLGTAQLGVWQFTDDGPWFHNLYIPGMLMALISALVLGFVAAWPAARRDDSRIGVAVSGAVGPLLVATAYFLATPRLVEVEAEQFSAYLLAPYAVIAGLAGSVLISALGSAAPATAGRPGAVPAGAEPVLPGTAGPVGPTGPGQAATDDPTAPIPTVDAGQPPAGGNGGAGPAEPVGAAGSTAGARGGRQGRAGRAAKAKRPAGEAEPVS